LCHKFLCLQQLKTIRAVIKAEVVRSLAIVCYIFATVLINFGAPIFYSMHRFLANPPLRHCLIVRL
jgi:hypothetical protein